MEIIILLSMIFLHIVDDFYLQGPLAKFKQKKFWKEYMTDESSRILYRYDWFISLMLHAFSWTFMIHIPLFIVYYSKLNSVILLIEFIITMCIHAFIDNLKANKLVIGLLTDQIVHIVQVLIIFSLYSLSLGGI